MGTPGFDIFQCSVCGLIEWIEVADVRQRDELPAQADIG